MGHADKKTSLNPFKPGERILWRMRQDKPAIYPGVVARIIAREQVSIRFDQPHILSSGREARGMIVNIKMLVREGDSK